MPWPGGTELLPIESHVFVLVTTNNTPLLPKNPKYSPEKLQPGRIGTGLCLFHKPRVMAGMQRARARSRWQSRLHIPESLSLSSPLPCEEGRMDSRMASPPARLERCWKGQTDDLGFPGPHVDDNNPPNSLPAVGWGGGDDSLRDEPAPSQLNAHICFPECTSRQAPCTLCP